MRIRIIVITLNNIFGEDFITNTVLIRIYTIMIHNFNMLHMYRYEISYVDHCPLVYNSLIVFPAYYCQSF